MNEIGVVNDGAVLIHNGIIQESGPARRIENLQQARNAREIDALGKVVMPAFVDPDALLVSPPGPETSLSVVSRKRLEAHASSSVAAHARAGALSVGAHTGCATDLRETTRALTIHHALQNKPLRIRSILSPCAGSEAREVIEKWLPAIRKKKIAAILEIPSPLSDEVREIAIAGAGAGYSLRIRAHGLLDESMNEFACAGGAVAILGAFPGGPESIRRLSGIGCVHVLAAPGPPQCPCAPEAARRLIEEGAAVALTSNSGLREYSSLNPQFLLYLAVANFGMTAEEAICATTWNSACSLRMSHVTGSLEPGKSGDVLIMDAGDYRDLARRPGHSDVLLALRAGRIIYRRGPIILD